MNIVVVVVFSTSFFVSGALGSAEVWRAKFPILFITGVGFLRVYADFRGTEIENPWLITIISAGKKSTKRKENKSEAIRGRIWLVRIL